MLSEPVVSVAVVQNTSTMGIDMDTLLVGPGLPGVKP